MTTCLVYRGRGVGPVSYRECVTALRELLPAHISVEGVSTGLLQGKLALKETRLLVFPGGRDVPYHEKLKGSGNASIRTFVEEGGRYLGICAGAYYAAAAVCFEPGRPLEVVGERELAFFPAMAQGPVYEYGRFRYDSEECAEAVAIEVVDGRRFCVYYNGGCWFVEPESHTSTVDVVARYYGVAGQDRAAIVRCQVGAGRALLTGVHLDYSPNAMALRGFCLEKVERLRADDFKRKKLFQELLTDLVG